MRLSARDVAVTALVLVLSSFLIYLYVDERGRSTVRSDEQALGKIVFKKRNATRRLRSGLVWERLRNDTPVYEADTLRTADASEATIVFDDGINLDLYENSMIRLVFKGKERTLEFLGGNISISASKGAAGSDLAGLAEQGKATAGYKISAGDKTIELSSSSSAVLNRSGDTLSVEVGAGEAAVTGADGTSETVDRSKALEINLATGTSQTVERTILPLLPEQNARLLSEGSLSAAVPFSWDTAGGPAGEATIEVSESKDFQSIAATKTVKETSVVLPVESGSWYWRVRAADGTVSSVRRFTMYIEPPPQPILPASGTEVSFRTQAPTVRFSWTQMDNAAYLFEIAGDKDFAKPIRKDRTTLEGITVNDLAEGTWYWRVTPLYAMSLLGERPEREVRTIVVRRRPEMVALTPTMPASNSLFLVQEVAAKGVGFSWLPQGEAVEYEVCLSKTKTMDDAVIRRAAAQAWLTLSGSEAAALASPGAWYWAVRWKDQEGNLSPYSEPRPLRGIDGALAIKLSFPPDGYAIADSLVGSTRFAWKSNLDTKEVFQLSPDASFSSVTWEEQTEAGTLIGRQWKTGTWYWRIKTLNADGTDLHKTEARMFRVVDPLAQPKLTAPFGTGPIRLRKEDRYTFRWDKVPAADYYQFELRFVPEQGAEVARYSTTLDGTQIELPLGGYQEGNYAVQLQAFGLDKEKSTRLIGYLGRTEVAFKPLLRVDLVFPGDGAAIAGLEARRAGLNFAWKQEEGVEGSELLVASDPDLRRIVARRSGGQGAAHIERMAAGDYYWTVKAALYGFDISAPRTASFSVQTIPPLPAPAQRSPTPAYHFGPTELRSIDALRFTWDAVPSATSYDFALYRGEEKTPILRSPSLKENAFQLDDFSILDNGDFRWTVTAKAFDGKGELEQDGTSATSTFRIELPPLRSPVPKEKEKFYGR